VPRYSLPTFLTFRPTRHTIRTFRDPATIGIMSNYDSKRSSHSHSYGKPIIHTRDSSRDSHGSSYYSRSSSDDGDGYSRTSSGTMSDGHGYRGSTQSRYSAGEEKKYRVPDDKNKHITSYTRTSTSGREVEVINHRKAGYDADAPSTGSASSQHYKETHKRSSTKHSSSSKHRR